MSTDLVRLGLFGACALLALLGAALLGWRLAARAAAASGEARYRELFERSPSPLVLHRRGVGLGANPAAAALFGFADTAAMVGFDFTSLFADADAGPHPATRLALLEALPLGGALPMADVPMRALDGRLLTVQASAVRVGTADGPASLSLFVDISARVTAEAARRRADDVLQTLFDNHPDGISLTVMDSGRYVTVNENFARLLGYRVDEVIGRTSTELGIWTHADARARLVAELHAHGRLRETPSLLQRKGGTRINVTWSATRVVIDGVEHLVSSLRDVTEAEQLRLEHAAVFRSAIVGIALTRDSRFQLANPRFHAIFGHSPGALIGQPGTAVWPSDDAYREAATLAAPLLSQSQPVRLERPMRRADGSVFWCRLQAQAVDPGNPQGGGTVWIAEDVTERRQLDASLAAARDAADAANRAKSAFLANTSHEIRTPLNGLLGLARLAAQDTVEPALRRQYLAQLVDSAQGLAGIISDILDLSKIEAGKLSVEALPFSLHHTLASVHRSYLPLAEGCGLAFRVEVDAALPDTVRGDAQRVRQILANFITNALKFTAHGSVTLSARPLGGDRLRLAVSDTGPGIDDALRQRLFTPFTQGDASITRRFGGSGLGLAICHELAALMGGEVGVDSQPGQGSRFWAELPLPPSALPAVPPAAAVEGQLAGTRVLMVEDNVVNMMIAVAMLQNWGVQVTQASDGREAVAAVQRGAGNGQPFDAVLMDVQMPVMSGHEATRVLRQMEAGRHLPIIALTAAALVTEREEALRAGMDDFLTKPIDADRLRAALLQRRRARAD